MASKITQFVLAASFLIVSMASALDISKQKPVDENMIRVAIVKQADDVVLSIRGKYRILDLNTDRELAASRNFKKSRALFHDKGIYIGKSFFPTNKLRIVMSKDLSVYRGGKQKRYRGMMDVIVKKKKMLFVNVLDLERYVHGVLYHEVSHRWPIEVIKAQAVATRSYALYQRQENKELDYDVSSDIYSQVYGGKSAERYRTNLAAKKTKGMYLKYQSKILPAYFHSTCAGDTEDAGELWKHDLAPLSGQRCEYCKRAPYTAKGWKKNFKSSDVQEKLIKAGHNIGLIKTIEILDHTKSGRVKNILITSRDGKQKKVKAKDFRLIVGPNFIKSNFFDIEMKGYYFDVRGKGWGHGVGMCQWGAAEMARQRYKFNEILSYYYPGAKIVKVR